MHDVSTASLRLPDTISTLQGWDALDESLRLEVLESRGMAYDSIRYTAPQALSAVSDPEQKILAQKMMTYMKANADLTPGDRIHALVGSLSATARFLLLKDAEILGGEVRYEHAGCLMPDLSTPHFSNKDGAHLGGCAFEPGDQWVATGVFDRHGKPLSVDEFMEWAGR